MHSVFRLALCVVGVWLIGIIPASAQILDDSTKLLYGPSTTKFVQLKDVKAGIDQQYSPDTGLYGKESYLYHFHEDKAYQDLGLFLTPLHPVYVQLDHSPGTRMGMDALSAYRLHPDKMKYFDTRSPYSRIGYVQGGRQQNILETEFSRPVNSLWNVGFTVRRATANRQVALRRAREIQTEHWGAAFNTRFTSRDSSYKLFLGYHHMRHKLFETGGIAPQPGETRADLFDYRIERVRLADTALNLQTVHQWHLYHTYAPGGGKWFLFHSLDRTLQHNSYDERNLRANISFYPVVADSLPRDTTGLPVDRVHQYYHHYRHLDQTFGTGWQIQSHWYVQAGFRIRSADLVSRWETKGPSVQEQYLEGQLGYQNRETTATLKGVTGPNGEFSLRLDAQAAGFSLLAAQSSVRPTFVDRYWDSDFYAWNQPLNNRLQSEVQVQYALHHGRHRLTPFARIARIENLIYRDTVGMVIQLSGSSSQWQFGARLETGIGRWHLHMLAQWAEGDREDLQPVPRWHLRARVYYAHQALKQTLPVQVGANFFYLSPYNGLQYMPATMQYYLQSSFTIQGYMYTELFLNFKVRTSTVFFKLCHLNQGLMGENGYFTTPFYTAQQRAIEFGFNWNFYD
jgi:hypothetical protein